MSSGRERLIAAFDAGAAENRALVMPFFVAGYPDPETFVELVGAAGAAGADVLEIGIPFSDPIMDGPVIAEATHKVLETGQRVDDVVKLLDAASKASGVPTVAMTYYNIPFQRGLEEFASQLAGGGTCGVIVPDLSVEDSLPWREAAAEAGLATTFLAAQTSPDARLQGLAEASTGFVYAASLLGVTGVREQLNVEASGLVGRIREAGADRVAVGIGVSTTVHANEVAQYADGVIVGSAITRMISESKNPVEAVAGFVAELRGAVQR